MPLPQLQATSSSEVPARTQQGACRAGSPLEQAAEHRLQRPPPVLSPEAPVGPSEAPRLEVRRNSPSPASPAVPTGSEKPLHPQHASLTQARRQRLFVGPHGPLDLPHGEDPAHAAAWSNSAAHSARPTDRPAPCSGPALSGCAPEASSAPSL